MKSRHNCTQTDTGCTIPDSLEGAVDKTGNILIVDDDEDILTAGRLLLRRSFATVRTCNRPDEMPRLVSENEFDAILLDMNFGPGESSGRQGLEWLERMLEIDPDQPRQTLCAAGTRNQANLDFGLSQFYTLCSHSVVAAHGNFQATA